MYLVDHSRNFLCFRPRWSTDLKSYPAKGQVLFVVLVRHSTLRNTHKLIKFKKKRSIIRRYCSTTVWRTYWLTFMNRFRILSGNIVEKLSPFLLSLATARNLLLEYIHVFCQLVNVIGRRSRAVRKYIRANVCTTNRCHRISRSIFSVSCHIVLRICFRTLIFNQPRQFVSFLC